PSTLQMTQPSNTSIILMCLSSVHCHTNIILLFLLIPLPPTSTLFPYTTLFRSCTFRRATSSGRQTHCWDLSKLAWARCRPPKQVDWKSTRLNSSHVEISYAVFCLKKKIILRIETSNEYTKILITRLFKAKYLPS